MPSALVGKIDGFLYMNYRAKVHEVPLHLSHAFSWIMRRRCSLEADENHPGCFGDLGLVRCPKMVSVYTLHL